MTLPIYRPTELRAFLQQLGIFPKKGLSQNFLIDGNIIRKIIQLANVQENDLVLEIGPGPGSLTQALLEKKAKLIAVEKDSILAEALQRLQTSTHDLQVFCEDILTFDFTAYLSDKKNKAKVIANLPYHLTTPIIAQLVDKRALISSLTIMVQEEMARRMTAQPSSSDYSSFTIFLQFYTEPCYGFGVGRQCFYPVPKVDSAVVTLKLKEPPLQEAEALQFFQITRLAFAHRRKMLRASLKDLFSPHQIEEALKSIGQNPLARPEALSLEEFLQFYSILKPFMPSSTIDV